MIILNKELERANSQKKTPVGFHVLIAVIGFGGFVTLALLIALSHPWEDNFAPRTASEYWGFLSLLLWAVAPYLPLLVMARKRYAARAGNLLRLIGAVIICGAGAGIYLDAFLRHPAPLSVLVFLAVPFYQWVGVALLMVMHFFFIRHNTKGSR